VEADIWGHHLNKKLDLRHCTLHITVGSCKKPCMRPDI
jgi:hypothetical protein